MAKYLKEIVANGQIQCVIHMTSGNMITLKQDSVEQLNINLGTIIVE